MRRGLLWGGDAAPLRVLAGVRFSEKDFDNGGRWVEGARVA